MDQHEREILVRHLSRSTRVEDMQALAVAWKDGRAVRLEQVAHVAYAAAPKRGDAGYGGAPAVVLSVQKQPGADTVKVTRAVESALQELARGRPAGIAEPKVLFRQADFIQATVGNVAEALRDGAVMVALVLFAFLLSLRTTAISLVAIPLSLAVTALVFHLLGLSINVMTLGGLAIAVGELVDDAVVDVENILRRLRQNRESATPLPTLEVVRRASVEVRSGIVVATTVVVLVFVPLFALPGIEGGSSRRWGGLHRVHPGVHARLDDGDTWRWPRGCCPDAPAGPGRQRARAAARSSGTSACCIGPSSTPRCWPARPWRRCWWRRARWRHCRAPSCRPSTRARWWWAS